MKIKCVKGGSFDKNNGSKDDKFGHYLIREIELDFVNQSNNIEACSCRCVSHCSCDCDRCAWHTLDT